MANKRGLWEARYWAAYEWASNHYHPSGNRVAAFASTYANANVGHGKAESIREFWAKWVAGKAEPVRIPDRGE